MALVPLALGMYYTSIGYLVSMLEITLTESYWGLRPRGVFFSFLILFFHVCTVYYR